MQKGIRYFVNSLLFLGMAAIPSGLAGSSFGATANLSILLALATPPPEAGEGKEEKWPQPSSDPESKEMRSPRSLSSTQKSLLQQRIKKEQEIAALKARIAELENTGKQRPAISGSGGTKRGSGERPAAVPDDSRVPDPSAKRQRKFDPHYIELGSHSDEVFYTNLDRIDHILKEHGYSTNINSHEMGGYKPLDTKFAKEFNSQESIIRLLSAGLRGDWEMALVEPQRLHKNYIVIRYDFTFDKVGFYDFGGEDWRETNRVEVIAYKFLSNGKQRQKIITAYPIRPVAD
jgi:hypothetical protein